MPTFVSLFFLPPCAGPASALSTRLLPRLARPTTSSFVAASYRTAALPSAFPAFAPPSSLSLPSPARTRHLATISPNPFTNPFSRGTGFTHPLSRRFASLAASTAVPPAQQAEDKSREHLRKSKGQEGEGDMGAINTGKVDTTKRLERLRQLMKDNGVNVYVVPSEDAHASEYPALADLRRQFISGFSGSAGCAVVTDTEAALFTDGRYFLQASQQLDDNWTLMKQGLPDVPTWQEYLQKNVPAGSKIGVDPTLVSAHDADALSDSLSQRKSSLVSLGSNLVDVVWRKDGSRPERPKEKVFLLGEEYSGKSFQDKVAELRKDFEDKSVKGYVAPMLDEVAWLFNLRGTDVPFNPVFFSYAIVTLDDVFLYIDPSQVDDATKAHLEEGNVKVRPYEAIWEGLSDVRSTLKENEKILLSNRASLAISEALGGKANVKIGRSPVIDLKAIKNPVELEGFRQSHVRDGAALARYFAWLEEQLEQGAKLSESEGSDMLEKFRSENEHFRGLSFPTISSAGPNGAIIHYSPDPANCATIVREEMYLCDSGAQYTDGTTDVTRTWHFSTPTKEQIRAFTRVLQGHIAIDTSIFPQGTTGYLLDPFARRALWEDGLDYRHGTGHGVGSFLNVHEGPHGIGTRAAFNETPLKEGMIVSNEPGYYEDGKWGIRIENLVAVKKANTPHTFGDKPYFGFETLTMCPVQTSLVDFSLLSPAEHQWVNDYHKEVYRKVAPLLEKFGDVRALKWLERQTKEV